MSFSLVRLPLIAQCYLSGVWSFMQRAVDRANANCASKLAGAKVGNAASRVDFSQGSPSHMSLQDKPSGPTTAISDLVAEITKEKVKQIHVDVKSKLEASVFVVPSL